MQDTRMARETEVRCCTVRCERETECLLVNRNIVSHIACMLLHIDHELFMISFVHNGSM